MKSNENISSNPFMSVLRTNFNKIYRNAVEKQSVLLLPSSASLIGVHITQILIETHILKSTHIPHNYLNLVGQGVEFRDGCVHTSFGFKEQRVCNILQEENMYDFSTSFKIICIDRPLQGKFESASNVFENSSSFPLLLNANFVQKTMKNWLRNRTDVLDEIHGMLNKFRETYILVSGFEHDAAFRIQEICSDASSMLAKVCYVSSQNAQQTHHLHKIVERYTYIHLHSFLWAHLVEIQKEKQNILKKKILSMCGDTQAQLNKLQVHASFQDITLDAPAEKLKEMDVLKSPEEKLECLHLSCQLINRAIHENFKKQNSIYPKQNKTTIEVSCDLILPLFICTLLLSGLKNSLAHAAHIDMYMAYTPYESRLEKSSYLFTTFHSALSYLLQTPLGN